MTPARLLQHFDRIRSLDLHETRHCTTQPNMADAPDRETET